MTGRDDRDDGDSFADHLGGVRPLAGRERALPPPERRTGPVRRPPPTADFEIEHRDGLVLARAPDVSRARLADLHAGRVPPQRELDLHGLDEVAARRALTDALSRALDDGLRCLLVIHGRGRRSPGGPVLQQAVPGWLASSPHAARIQAFASAPRKLGGAGACLVLLRRR